jgi:hypothetical protein
MSIAVGVLVKQLNDTLAELAVADLDTVAPTELADVLVDLLGADSRLDAVCAQVAGRVDASMVWANDGSRSCAGWLGRAAHRDRREMAGLVRRARQLRAMPGAQAAHGAGTLSARHIRLLATAQQTAPDHYDSDEAWLVTQATVLGFDDFARVIAYWCQCAAPDQAEDDARDRYDRRRLHLSGALDGTGVLDVEFEPIGFGVFAEALRRIEQQLWDADWAEARGRLGDAATKADLVRSDAHRRYDALIEMARRSAAMPKGARKPIPLITVHVDHQTLVGRVCELATGTIVTPGEILPLLSQADIERAVFDPASRVIDLGHRSRLFVGGTRRAVQIQHRHCTHPTCDIPAERCDIDHITPWQHGGRTDRDNATPLCPTHHPGRRHTNQRRQPTKTPATHPGSDPSDDDPDPPD